MRSSQHHLQAWKGGSLLFLGIALLLALASGDSLLVLAVGSAVSGIALLTMRRVGAYAARPAATPQIDRAAEPARAGGVRPHTNARTMAVRRPRPLLRLGQRGTSVARAASHGAAPPMCVTKASGQA